ncbi:MAG: hypothetical protein R3E39_17645 [Anaerolineae bacterium]
MAAIKKTAATAAGTAILFCSGEGGGVLLQWLLQKALPVTQYTRRVEVGVRKS